MNILFIHGIAEIGGAERELLLIVKHLLSSEYYPMVVCPQNGPLVGLLHQENIKTWSVPFPSWRKLICFPKRIRAIKALSKVIQTVRPKLIHVNDIWWVPQTLRAVKDALGRNIPIVAHVRQEIEPAKVRRYELHQPALVFSVSGKVKNALAEGGVAGGQVRILYSGVEGKEPPPQEEVRNIRRQYQIPPDARVLGTIGNLFPRKGYEVMLEAFPKILQEFPDVHYLIIGKGSDEYERFLRSRVKKMGLQDRIHFVGFQKFVYPYLACLDVYVHPACMEGFGISVLESMAMGKPVVATRTGGLPEIVQEDETGLLVSPGDPWGLCKAISLLLGDIETRTQMGESGRTRVLKNFSVEKLLRQLTHEYSKLLENFPTV